ncbi:MAG TPA: sensor histidine kinase [Acidimicrobiales bacterium]
MRTLAFHHEAFLYAGVDGFVDGAARFLAPALAAGAPALVLSSGTNLAGLRSALGARAGDVEYADVTEVGRNPAWILGAWCDFADAHAGSDRVWGIGEPAWPWRSPAELVECRHHEALLNVAMAERTGVELLCPYDTATLPPDVVEGARTTHPVVGTAAGSGPSTAYRDVGDGGSLLAEPLPAPPADAVEIDVGRGDPATARHHVERLALEVGFETADAKDLALAVDEVVTNSERHGSGPGRLAAWPDAGSLVCEVRDAGQLTDPLVGRRRPPPTQVGGRGLWITNRLCDLVQVRSSVDEGTVVRLHKRRDQR